MSDFYFQALHCGSCQEKWFCCGRNCYYFSEEKLTWDESVKICHNKGSSLVKIDDNKELNFIQSQMKYAYWVGLSRKGTMHEWTWQDGTALAKNL
ncbi:natural killer cells antigen CD94-like [Ochotona princeps]|uniref:natural killer cells antigen CD94-like n=1 Tax=Ochotona princeps TaxID=9978 RepID=UPI0027155121|nr:natural killer cells antigen CD94-like [Ochotona princeps]